MKYQNNKDLAEAQYYLKMLGDFCKTGQVIIPDSPQNAMPWNTQEDPLKDYLVHLFTLKVTIPSTGEEVQKFCRQVVNSKIKSKVFYDSVGKFIVECVHHIRFQRQRAWTENHRAEEVLDWTNFKRMDEQVWHPLLDQLEQEHGDDGFDKPFFLRLFKGDGASKTENWERLVRDWKACIERQTLSKLKNFISIRQNNFETGLIRMMDQVTRNMKMKGVTEQRAVQAWELMTNGWTETEFERRLNEMKVQDRYPEIKEIVLKMGRVADANGKDRLTIASGVEMKMEHSAGSDIEGITVGDDLNSLLPLELAQYSDEDMEGLFIYKYRTRRLQTFRYKSEMSKPSRKLGFTHASRKGPMIVCLDTSASMYGTPERISSTLVSLLEQTAEDLERDCYLIDFSVSTRAIDLMEKRKANRLRKIGINVVDEFGVESLADSSSSKSPTDFTDGTVSYSKDSYSKDRTKTSADYSSEGMGHTGRSVRRQASTTHLPFIGGGTSAKKMMKLMFDLLDNDGLHYVNADVLWITDFLIPDPPQSLLSRFKEYRETGTRFYGIRIIRDDDKAENTWKNYFNEIYTIKYRPLRRY